MTIHLGRHNGLLKSIELDRIHYHKALSHLNQLVSYHHTEYQDTLCKIHIEHSLLDDNDYKALKDILNHCPNILIVELIANHLDMSQAQTILSELAQMQLNSLSFTDNWIGEKIPSDFFDFMGHQEQINIVDFSVNWLRDKGVTQLVAVLNPSVKQLQLSCNDVDGEGVEAIADFVCSSPNFADLDMSYNHLNHKSASSIARMINDSSMSTIKLNSNLLGDNGVKVIADALSHCDKAISVNLSDNQISLKGAKYLIKNVTSSGVRRHLDLRFNAVDYRELRPIIAKAYAVNPSLEIKI